MEDMLIFIGAVIIILWGIAHLIPTKNIVKGFGEISADNKKILAMEVIAEGLTLIFLGLIAILAITAGEGHTRIVHLVNYTEAGFLFVLALVTLFTGARTKTVWYKVCPLVKTAVAVLFILGAVL
jgi:hypothetical protein